MNSQTVLKELKKKGKANTIQVYRKHGVKGPCFGVSYADIGKLTKRLQGDHYLSLELWKSGVHDARVLATRVADAEKLTVSDLDQWLASVDNYVLDDALSSLAARSKVADTVARKWIKSPDEWRAAAGWNVIAILAMDGRLKSSLAATLLRKIERGIQKAKNRARHSMNNALIAMGGSFPTLEEQALSVARAIGKVNVDHGPTSCRTPDAANYIEKMVSRQKKQPASRKKASAASSKVTKARRVKKTGRAKPPAKPQTRSVKARSQKKAASSPRSTKQAPSKSKTSRRSAAAR